MEEQKVNIINYVSRSCRIACQSSCKNGVQPLALLVLPGRARPVGGTDLLLLRLRDTGKMRWREFATAVPHDSVYSVLREVAENTMGIFGIKMGLTDNASVNIVPHPSGGKGRALALTGTIILVLLIPNIAPPFMLRLHRTSWGFFIISTNARQLI